MGLQLGPGWAIPGPPHALSSAVGTGVDPRGHVSPSTHPQQCQARESARMCTCTHTVVHKLQGDTHKHSHGLDGKATSTQPQPPQAVRILYPQGLGLEDTPSSRAPPSPSLSLSHPVWSAAPPFLWGSPVQKHTGCGTSTWGRGGPAVSPAPSPLLPWDLSHPGPGASRPPVGPSSRSLKARVVWEEFRHGGGRGGGQKRKEERR